MHQDLRLENHPVLGAFRRGRQVKFTFEGQPLVGCEGEPVAAALLANGIRALRTSRLGEPRGVFCGIGQCFECRVIIDGKPHKRACLVPLQEDMDVKRQADVLPKGMYWSDGDAG